MRFDLQRTVRVARGSLRDAIAPVAAVAAVVLLDPEAQAAGAGDPETGSNQWVIVSLVALAMVAIQTLSRVIPQLIAKRNGRGSDPTEAAAVLTEIRDALEVIPSLRADMAAIKIELLRVRADTSWTRDVHDHDAPGEVGVKIWWLSGKLREWVESTYMLTRKIARKLDIPVE